MTRSTSRAGRPRFASPSATTSASLRYTRTVVYGTLEGANTFAVIAVDTAGNRSAPATVTTTLDCVP
jgi:hypothetical protein